MKEALLKQARRQQHWTQMEAAERAGIGLSTYAHVEGGLRKGSKYTIDRIVKLFKKSPEELGLQGECKKDHQGRG